MMGPILQNQPVTDDNSSFTKFRRDSNELWDWKTFVSSANRIKRRMEDTL